MWVSGHNLGRTQFGPDPMGPNLTSSSRSTVMNLANNPKHHKRPKHITPKYHCVRYLVDKKSDRAREMIVDPMTKR